ncbi:unnamed protein product [Prorocentrum cordatum]|uniref:Uncharacterized protein n=1 Tax=Prorocentrum cordatum TaxID=2364126 RepID=A0ABN9S8H0_9DINO|nr:unnamed protein product [Polarella glacialis]
MGRKIELSNDAPFVVRLPPEASQGDKVLTSFPSVVACAAGVDQCAICLEEVGPAEVLTELSQSSARRFCSRGRVFLSCTFFLSQSFLDILTVYSLTSFLLSQSFLSEKR